MTKKDIRKVETIVKKILDDIIYEPDSLTLQEHDEAML